MRAQTPRVCVDHGSHGGSMGFGCDGWWHIMLSKPKRRWYRLYARTSYWNDYRYSRGNIKTPEEFVDALLDAYNALEGVCNYKRVSPDLSGLDELDPEFGRQARTIWEQEGEKWLRSPASTLGVSSLIMVGGRFGGSEDKK